MKGPFLITPENHWVLNPYKNLVHGIPPEFLCHASFYFLCQWSFSVIIKAGTVGLSLLTLNLAFNSSIPQRPLPLQGFILRGLPDLFSKKTSFHHQIDVVEFKETGIPKHEAKEEKGKLVWQPESFTGFLLSHVQLCVVRFLLSNPPGMDGLNGENILKEIGAQDSTW